MKFKDLQREVSEACKQREAILERQRNLAALVKEQLTGGVTLCYGVPAYNNPEGKPQLWLNQGGSMRDDQESTYKLFEMMRDPKQWMELRAAIDKYHRFCANEEDV